MCFFNFYGQWCATMLRDFNTDAWTCSSWSSNMDINGAKYD